MVLKKISNLFSILNDKIPILQPSDTSYIICSFMILVSFIICNFCMMISTSFKLNLFKEFRFIPSFGITTILLEFLLQTNTIFYEKGEKVQSRRNIFIKYCKTQLLLDGVCLFNLLIYIALPFEIMNWFNLSFIFYVAKISTVIKKI